MQRTFGSWKLRHCDEKREAFASSLAKQHYNRKVKGHVWSAWHGILKMDWKQRAEAACQVREGGREDCVLYYNKEGSPTIIPNVNTLNAMQKKAEEVCMELTAEYEEKLAAVSL